MDTKDNQQIIATEEAAPATQVVVYEARRLIRQSLSMWLNAQDDIELAGTANSGTAVASMCDTKNVDVVLVGLLHDHERVLHEAEVIAQKYENVRLIAITDDAHEEADRALAHGFRAVVNANAGAANLLRVIRAGAVARSLNPPVQTIDTTGPLTPREAEVLALVGQGNTADDISDELGISPSTIANHKERIYEKLDVNNQAHAVAVAMSRGIIQPTQNADIEIEPQVDLSDSEKSNDE